MLTFSCCNCRRDRVHENIEAVEQAGKKCYDEHGYYSFRSICGGLTLIVTCYNQLIQKLRGFKCVAHTYEAEKQSDQQQDPHRVEE